MSDATISWLSGPVLRARTSGRFHVSDAILVGEQQLLGEVIRVDGEGIVAQVYEDTTGLRPGDEVTSRSEPLSIRLRPGLLGNIFGGLGRTLVRLYDLIIFLPLSMERGLRARRPERGQEPAATAVVAGARSLAHMPGVADRRVSDTQR